MKAPICNRKEYGVLLRALHSVDRAGVLLSGESGTGKSELIRKLLASSDLSMPVIRLICSAALTKTPYGSLAPLLADLGERINDVIAIREVQKAIQVKLNGKELKQQVLILVEDAQFIDSASAFVLGQAVRSGSVKLLVLSNEDHLDPIALEALMSVARLTRVRLEALTVDEVADFADAFLGGKLCIGSAKIIHLATAGFYTLVQGYLELASRHDALVKVQGQWVLKKHDLQIDEHAVEDMKDLANRQNLAHQSVVELLSLCGPLTLKQLDLLGMCEALDQQKTTLVKVRNGKAWLASTYYAEGIRQGISPGHKQAIYEKISATLGTDLPSNPQFAQMVLGLGNQLPSELLLKIVGTSNNEHNFSLTLEIFDQWGEETDGLVQMHRIRALIGSGLLHSAAKELNFPSHEEQETRTSLHQNLELVLQWFQIDETFMSESFVEGEETALDKCYLTSQESASFKQWQDCQTMAKIQDSRRYYQLGRLSDALRLATAQVEEELHLAPACYYRLSFLVVAVRSMIASGDYGTAHAILDDFLLEDAYETLYCYGTVQVLRTLVLTHQGQMSQARECLLDASAELSLHDPEAMSALCAALFFITNTRNSGHVQVTGEPSLRNTERSPIGLELRPISSGARFWWDQDLLQTRLLDELEAVSVSVEGLTAILDLAGNTGILMQDQLNYLVWIKSNNDELRDRSFRYYEHLSVPADCKSMEIHKQIVLRSSSVDVQRLEAYARELHAAGEKVFALEISTKIVDYWTIRQNLRNRGFAIRKIQSWLSELNQEPWGIIAQALNSSGLTSREEEIIDLVRRGMGNNEIARQLTVSQRTVEGHLYRIFSKLGITKRSELNLSE